MLHDEVELLARISEVVRDAFEADKVWPKASDSIAVDDAAQPVRDVHDVAVLVMLIIQKGLFHLNKTEISLN